MANIIQINGKKVKDVNAARMSSLAPVESSTTASMAHAVGDYFWLNGTLYEATAAITVGNAISVGTNCKITNMGENLADLKSAIEKTSVPSETITGKYINYLGAESSDSTYDCSDFIDISEFIKISFSGTLYGIAGLAFYKSDKSTVVSCINGTNASNYGYTSKSAPQNINRLPVPDGAAYIRFTRRNAYPVTTNDFAVVGIDFSGIVPRLVDVEKDLANINPSAYVEKSGIGQVTTQNTDFLDTVWINAFDGEYTDGYAITGSSSSGYTLSANSARYNLAIIPVKPSTKYTIVGGISSGTIAIFRCVTATRLLSVSEAFDGSFVLSLSNTTNPYYYTFTTGANDKYLYVYGLNYLSNTRPFIQLAEGEIAGFTTDQYNVSYGVPNKKMAIPSGSVGVKVVPVSATRFNLLVYDQASKIWITHTFRKAYTTHTLSYGSGQSKSVVTSDVWYAEYIKDSDGNNLMQGNTNFIHYLNNTGHQGHVGAGHGCAVAVYTLFFADGQLIDPTSLTKEVECSVFRMTEKVNHYLIDQASTTSSSDAIPSLDGNGDPIVESVEYLDAEWTICNNMKLRNRLDIVMDGLEFQQCFAGMLTGYYPYFDNIMINNPEYIYNGLSGSGSAITIEAKGGTTTVLSSQGGGFFDADEVILYGDKYRVYTRIVANDPARYDKLNVETAAMPPNYDSRIKAYFMPCVCTQSYPLIDKGETVEIFNAGDILDVMIYKKLDVSV